MSPPEKKRRAANFTDEELLMLVQQVDERRKVIMGALSPRITAKAKDNEWKAVTEAVNSISRVSRDVLEIRKKIRTFRSEVKKKAAKERSEREVTGGGIPDTKDWKPTEEVMLALIVKEAVHGQPGPFESEDVIADEPLPSTSAGSVARPILLTRTHDEHAPLPNEPQSTSGAARARPVSTTFDLEPSTSWENQEFEDIWVAAGIDDPTRHSTMSVESLQSVEHIDFEGSGLRENIQSHEPIENITNPQTVTFDHSYSTTPHPASSTRASRHGSRVSSRRASPQPCIGDQMLAVQGEILQVLRVSLPCIASALEEVPRIASALEELPRIASTLEELVEVVKRNQRP